MNGGKLPSILGRLRRSMEKKVSEEPQQSEGPQQSEVIFTVPPGVRAGQQIVVQAPNGQRVKVQLPPNTIPGQRMQVSVPEEPQQPKEPQQSEEPQQPKEIQSEEQMAQKAAELIQLATQIESKLNEMKDSFFNSRVRVTMMVSQPGIVDEKWRQDFEQEEDILNEFLEKRPLNEFATSHDQARRRTVSVLYQELLDGGVRTLNGFYKCLERYERLLKESTEFIIRFILWHDREVERLEAGDKASTKEELAKYWDIYGSPLYPWKYLDRLFEFLDFLNSNVDTLWDPLYGKQLSEKHEAIEKTLDEWDENMKNFVKLDTMAPTTTTRW